MKFKIESNLIDGFIPGTLLKNPEVSLRAKALYALFGANSRNGETSFEELAKHTLESRSDLRSATRELIDAGFAAYDQTDGIIWLLPGLRLSAPEKTREIALKRAVEKPKKRKSAFERLGPAIRQMYFDRVFDLADYFDEHLRPKTPQQTMQWAETLEKLERIDEVPYETVRIIVQWAREDDFWSKNFLSPLKLRKKNSEGIPYIVVFNEAMRKGRKQKMADAAAKNSQGWED